MFHRKRFSSSNNKWIFLGKIFPLRTVNVSFEFYSLIQIYMWKLFLEHFLGLGTPKFCEKKTVWLFWNKSITRLYE